MAAEGEGRATGRCLAEEGEEGSHRQAEGRGEGGFVVCEGAVQNLCWVSYADNKSVCLRVKRNENVF